MKIAIFDSKNYDETTFNVANKSGHELVFIKERLTSGVASKASGAEAVCTFVNCKLDSEAIDVLANAGIKYIFQRSAGYNNIDLKFATEKGIRVFRVPAYSPEAVAEFAMTLLTSVNRNITRANNRTMNNNFALDSLQGDTIFGQTIGVIGAGRIGQCFIRIAKGFGANVIVFDEFAEKNFPNTAKDLGFEYTTKEKVFQESDYISLHAPLLPNTKHIVNKETLSLMKESAIIVNTARGGLINTEDLLNAIDNGKLRGAGLDVYEGEEGIFFFDMSSEKIEDPILNRMTKNDKVILTSHQAFFTNLALEQIASTSIQNADDAQNNNFDKSLEILEDGKIKNG